MTTTANLSPAAERIAQIIAAWFSGDWFSKS